MYLGLRVHSPFAAQIGHAFILSGFDALLDTSAPSSGRAAADSAAGVHFLQLFGHAAVMYRSLRAHSPRLAQCVQSATVSTHRSAAVRTAALSEEERVKAQEAHALWLAKQLKGARAGDWVEANLGMDHQVGHQQSAGEELAAQEHRALQLARKLKTRRDAEGNTGAIVQFLGLDCDTAERVLRV